MSPCRVSMLAAVLVVASFSGAPAQSWPQPQQQSSAAWPQSNPAQQSNSWQTPSNPWQQQQQPQQAARCEAFLPLRSEAEKAVVAVNAAGQKKAPREEFCQLFTRLANATAKMLKFLEQNKAQCGVPEQAIVNVRNEHNRTLTIRKNACAAGSGPAPSAAPSLSEVLSSPILPDEAGARPNTGTFNTLTGNPLIR